MDYWEECISQALEEQGIEATAEQISSIAGWVENAHENYGMAHGYDAIPNPVESEAERKLEEIERKQEAHNDWVLSTKPCESCITTGIIKDGWGRDVECGRCSGKGRY